MFTNPDGPLRADDELITLLSGWLARHVGDDELRPRIEAIGSVALSPDQAEAVDELLQELDRGTSRGDLEMVVRETVEALAMG
jgi:hypothetical protein